MFEYQGWATILPTYYEDDAAEDAFDDETAAELIAELEKLAADHKACNINNACGIGYMNGNLRCWFMGYSNHRCQEWEEIMAYFQTLAAKAPGSYGILSCRDDEDPVKNNAFQIFILKKGRIIEADDIWLSPCVPEIEEI